MDVDAIKEGDYVRLKEGLWSGRVIERIGNQVQIQYGENEFALKFSNDVKDLTKTTPKKQDDEDDFLSFGCCSILVGRMF